MNLTRLDKKWWAMIFAAGAIGAVVTFIHGLWFLSVIGIIVCIAAEVGMYISSNFPSASDELTPKSDIVYNRKVEFDETPAGGYARWMRRKEIADWFEVGPPEDAEYDILGMLGQDAVSDKIYADRPTGNLHKCIIGGSGDGKSSNVSIPNTFQGIYTGRSMVLSDPKTELFAYSAGVAKEMDYQDLMRVDISHPEYSMCWNFLAEAIDKSTMRLSFLKLDRLIRIYSDNLSEENKNFWSKNTENLFFLIVSFLAYSKESEVMMFYAHIYQLLTGVSANDLRIQQFKHSMYSIRQAQEDIMSLTTTWSKEDREKLRGILNRAYKYTENRFNVAKMVDVMNRFEDYLPLIRKIPEWYSGGFYALSAFNANGAEAVVGGTKLGLFNCMSIFKNPEYKSMLSYDEVSLQNLNINKSILYVTPDDKNNESRELSSLVFSFALSNSMENTERHHIVSSAPPTIPITFMLDEFYSLGTLGGQPDDFLQKMSVVRSYGIDITIILQTIGQIDRRYKEHARGLIQGNCSTFMFLGTNDLETAEFVEGLFGKARVKTKSYGVFKTGLSSEKETGNATYSTQIVPLVPASKLMGWDSRQILIKKRGTSAALVLDGFYWTKHPLVKWGDVPTVFENGKQVLDPSYAAKIDEFIKPLNERVAEYEAEWSKPENQAEFMINEAKLLADKYGIQALQ